MHSSLLPLSVSSGLKSELPKNGRVPLHLRPPCLHPEKNQFSGLFFFFLFLRALAKSSFKPQPFVRWYPIYPALSSDQKMPPTSDPFLVYHPWRQSGTQEPYSPLCPRKAIPSEWETTKICSPLLLAWCHCLLGLDSKLR